MSHERIYLEQILSMTLTRLKNLTNLHVIETNYREAANLIRSFTLQDELPLITRLETFSSFIVQFGDKLSDVEVLMFKKLIHFHLLDKIKERFPVDPSTIPDPVQ